MLLFILVGHQVTLSSLLPLLKGLMKSTQTSTLDNTHVQAFQAAAGEEISKRWGAQMTYKDDAANTSIIAASLDPRFHGLKFPSSDESLKVQVKIQAPALKEKERDRHHRGPNINRWDREQACVFTGQIA